MKKESVPVRNSLLLLLTATIWGVAFVAQSVSMDYIGGFTFNAVRNIIGAIALLPVIWGLGKTRPASEQRPSDRKTLITGGICCGILLCLASNFQQFGIKYTTVGKAGFITALYIVLVPIFGIFLKKRVPKAVWFSVVLAVAGLYCLCVTESFTISSGDICVVLCAFVFTCQILLVDHFVTVVDGIELSCCQFFFVTLFSLAGSLAFEQPTLEGYTFDGWYTEPVGGTKISTSTVFTGDTTVYAHWTVKNASSATTPAAPTEPVQSPEILDHLGGFVVAGVLFGTLAIASLL